MRGFVAEQPAGSDIVDGLRTTGDVIVIKRAVGGFHETDLHRQLQERGVDTLIMVEIATNLGVEPTSRAAADHGYELIFVEDAMSALTAEEHRAAVKHSLPWFGEVVAARELAFDRAGSFK
jgi:nicotinamidase-related amidase